MKKSIMLIITSLLFFACKTEKEKVVASSWKYQEGYHVGDVIEFNSGYFSVDDSSKIYKNGAFVGRIKKVSNNELQIQSTDNQLGSYIFLEQKK